MTTVPPGFERRAHEETIAIVRTAEAGRLERAGLLAGNRIADPETFFGEGARRIGDAVRRGRGTIVVLSGGSRDHRSGSAAASPPGSPGTDAGSEGPRILLKKYRRGGLTGRVLPDLFASEGRMLADLAASERLRGRGVQTAMILALVFVRQVAGTAIRGYVVLEEVRGAATLAEALRLRGTAASVALAERAVRLVRHMHDAGVLHRDLNLGNLLVTRDEIVVIDLDGARIVERAPERERFANLSRLDRSYLKTFGEEGPLSHDDRQAMLAAYAGTDADLRRALDARIDAHKRALARHRKLWRTGRPSAS